MGRAIFLFAAAVLSMPAQPMTENAGRQIRALLEEKAGRNLAQRKMDSHLVHAAKILHGRAVHPDFVVPPGEVEAAGVDGARTVEVDIRAEVTTGLLARLASLGATEIRAFSAYRSIRVRIPLDQVERVAERDEVYAIRMADYGHSSAGPDSNGDIAHQANLVRAKLGFDGTGVKVGVLSDGVNSLVAEQAAGRLPAVVNVLPTLQGSGDEGTAMLEIVYSLAPGATLYFATSTGGPARMASNIQALADAGCTVIIDDWTYFSEGVFEDGPLAQKVNEVAGRGVFYFSDAQNSGSTLIGNSGTWEGDFLDSGLTSPLIHGGAMHNFGTAAKVVNYDVLSAPAENNHFRGNYLLKWSDPLGKSSNDYDLFILDAGMNTVLGSSTNVQDGGQDPEESISGDIGIPAQSRVVIVKSPKAAVRALHLDTERGRLDIGTSGATFGHNAAAGAFTMAAASVWTAGGGAFAGGMANPSEPFGSDGPRRIFYNPDGTEITPGNLVFGSNGGTVLMKPEFTAADGVTTGVPGYAEFFGTSAAAPHAGAIAALVLQAKPTITIGEMRAAFTASALDIDGPGFDFNSGAGLVMAEGVLNAALGLLPGPSINTGGIVNAASGGARVAPGSIASVYGNFAGTAISSASSTPLAVQMGGLSVSGVPLFYVSLTQLNVQIPWALAGEAQTLFSARADGATGAGVTVTLAAWAPGLFSVNGQGTGQGSIVDAAGRLVDGANAAVTGEVVSIYCTGLGPVTNTPASGDIASSALESITTVRPEVTVGGAVAVVKFAGLAPGTVGEYQVNVVVPAGAPRGVAVPLVLTIGGVVSNAVTIAIQ